MSRLRLAGAAILAAVAVGTGFATQPASAEEDPGTLTGTSTNRHGTITLYFTTDPGWMRVKLEGKVRATSRAKLFLIQCRDGDHYVKIAGIHVGATSRFLGAPATVPVGTDRCRVRRDGTIIAEMRMRTTR